MNSFDYLTQAVVVGKPAPPAILTGLPVEIWIIIFRHLVFSFPARSRLSVLFNIMTVCHHWSNMIVNAASLWTSIVLEVSRLSSAAAPLMLNEALLGLTQGCAIDVTIVLPDDASTPITHDHHVALVELLAPHIHHMRSLELTGRHWPFHVEVMNLFCGVALPMLESFAITAYVTPGSDQIGAYRLPMFTSPFGDITAANAQAAHDWARQQFPRLTSVDVSGAPYLWTDFPLSNLKRLTITDQPVSCRPAHRTLQRILTASKDTLREFEAVDCLEHPLYDVNVTPVVLSALQALNFGYSDPGEVETFLAYIEAPHLEELTLMDQCYVPAEPEHTADQPSIDSLLRKLMDRLPLSKLRSLSCVNVSFVPDSLDMFSAADVACGLVPESEMAVLLQFIRRLVSLEDLSISGSGKAFLYYMNYMAQHVDPVTGVQIVPLERGWIPRLNLPKLRTLDIDLQEPNCNVLALMERRVVPGLSGEDGRYYGPQMCVLDITVSVEELCMEDVQRVERISLMCPSLRIITPEDRLIESVLTMDIDVEVDVPDVEMVDCF